MPPAEQAPAQASCARHAGAAWLLDHLDALRECAARGPVLDLACGRGRNAAALAEHGVAVTAVDRNPAFLRELSRRTPGLRGALQCVRADLESDLGIPFHKGTCGGLLVFRFLFRPLAPALEQALLPGGLLFYETFTTGQRAHGWGPTRAEFLLEPGELPQLFPNLEVLHYDEAPSLAARPEASARLIARRPARG